MSPTVTQTQKTAVELKPQIKTELVARLAAYALAKEEIKRLQEYLNTQVEAIATIYGDAGLQGTVNVDGYKVAEVTPTRSVLNRERLIAMGVTTAMLQQATEVVPSKPYMRITTPEVSE